MSDAPYPPPPPGWQPQQPGTHNPPPQQYRQQDGQYPDGRLYEQVKQPADPKKFTARPAEPKKFTGRQWFMVLAGFVALMVAAAAVNADLERTASRVEQPTSRDELLQAELDRRWPTIGDRFREDSSSVGPMADLACNIMISTKGSTDVERGGKIGVAWLELGESGRSHFDDMSDFGAFIGLMAAYRCPEAAG